VRCRGCVALYYMPTYLTYLHHLLFVRRAFISLMNRDVASNVSLLRLLEAYMQQMHDLDGTHSRVVVYSGSGGARNLFTGVLLHRIPPKSVPSACQTSISWRCIEYEVATFTACCWLVLLMDLGRTRARKRRSWLGCSSERLLPQATNFRSSQTNNPARPCLQQHVCRVPMPSDPTCREAVVSKS